MQWLGGEIPSGWAGSLGKDSPLGALADSQRGGLREGRRLEGEAILPSLCRDRCLSCSMSFGLHGKLAVGCCLVSPRFYPFSCGRSWCRRDEFSVLDRTRDDVMLRWVCLLSFEAVAASVGVSLPSVSIGARSGLVRCIQLRCVQMRAASVLRYSFGNHLHKRGKFV